MALINCKECGKELSDTAEFCPHCGYKYINNAEHVSEPIMSQQEQSNIVYPEQVKVHQIIQPIVQEQPATEIQSKPVVNSNNNKSLIDKVTKNKTLLFSGIIVVIALVVGIIIAKSLFNIKQEQNKAIKVDISMTSYYGTIENILNEFGLDFNLVTAGANCMTGVKKSEFTTVKYGILHTEFSYCKLNESVSFRIYNSSDDQPLREPNPGEIPTFDRYGRKTSYNDNKL